jgi:hypothetical protein
LISPLISAPSSAVDGRLKKQRRILDGPGVQCLSGKHGKTLRYHATQPGRPE